MQSNLADSQILGVGVSQWYKQIPHFILGHALFVTLPSHVHQQCRPLHTLSDPH